MDKQKKNSMFLIYCTISYTNLNFTFQNISINTV